MTREPDSAVMIETPGVIGEDRNNERLGSGQVVDGCLLVASQLLNVVDEETKALHTFNSDLLLRIITQKDALVRELGVQLKTLKRNVELTGQPSDPAADIEAGATNSQHQLPASEVTQRRLELKNLLGQIERNNELNRIFIEGSLSYGRELLELFVPGTYVIGQEGQAERSSPSTKGLALNKEA